MAELQFLHGIEVLEQANAIRPVPVVDTATIGLVCTAPNADATVFPLNTPVLLNSDPILALSLGTAGTAKDAVDLIYTQGGARVILVRVPEGASLYETFTNMIGDPVARTGSWAFLTCRSKLGLTPKILIAPGYTSQSITGAVTQTTLTAGGAGYTAAPDLTFTTGSGAQITAVVDVAGTVTGLTIDAGGQDYVGAPTLAFSGPGTGAAATLTVTAGVITAAVIIAAGTGYVTPPVATVIPSPGTGAAAIAIVNSGTVTAINMTRAGFNYAVPPIVKFSGPGAGAVGTTVIGNAANPVCADLQAIAARLRSVFIKDGPNSTDAAAVQDRQNYGTDRCYIVDPGILVWDKVLSTPISKPASAAVAGLISRVDNDEGFWVSPSNHFLYGIIGTARPIDFNISDRNTQASYLNQNDVATIIRAEGFRLWGNATTASDPLWNYLCVRRTADAVYESLERGMLWALDRPITAVTILNIAESVNRFLRDLVTRGAIIGGRCWIDPKENTPQLLQQGILTASFDIEPPAPLEHLVFKAYRNGDYYEEVIERVNRDMAF